MKGFVGKAVTLLGWASALAGVGCCHTYRDLVDPCYPERYEYQARAETNGAFAPQVSNGHVLDQAALQQPACDPARHSRRFDQRRRRSQRRRWRSLILRPDL